MGNLKRENYSPLARAVSLKTMNKKTVLLILVDGMRHDYINPVDSPFLDALRKQNIDAVVRETFAFELRPAFFAGLQPDECDIANMFYYDPANSPFRSIDVSHGDRAKITLELRAEAEKRGYSLAKYVGGCADIPLELLKYFDFSEKYHTADPGSIANHKTLFDYLRNDGKKWLWIAYPDGPAVTAGVLDKFLTTVTGGEDFIYLHFSELDWVGHEFGPHSLEQKRTLMEIDEAIRKIFCKLNQSFSEVRSVIFGDHGQVEIKKNIDIESKLKKTGLVLEKDYLYFIDSTQARFWFYNDTAKKKVIDLLRAIPDGKILTAADYKRLQFRFKHNKFGELIFVVNDGVGIFPNFFQHSSPCKGLHGYLPEVEGNWAKLIVTGCGIDKKIDSPVEMVSLFPTLLELLDYRKPSSLLVQSIFERENIRVATEKYSASIVIPTYNRLHTLKKCIAAIEKQGYPKEKFELIVVNDGSADGTEGFLEEYQKDTKLNFKYFNQVNTGPAAARNIGIKNAEGYIIILIGDDMIMGPEFVENHIDFHQVWPQISHACLGFIDWSQDIALNTIMDLITSKDGGQQFCWHIIEEQDPDNIIWSVFWSSNISFKRNFSLTHGLFNADFFKHAMWEDVELGYRLSRAGLILHFRKTVKVFHEHFITFESFAKRQRMVGWYSQGLPAMGLSMNYSPNDDKRSRIYSDKVFKFITGILSQPTVETACNNKEILREIYNYGLHYAGLTGYVEKENGLTEDVEGGLGLLLNLSRAERQLDDKNRQLAKHMQELEGRDRLLLENELIITERDGQIANIEAAIKEKDANIEDLEGLLREREAEAGGLRAGLEEKERKIGNLQETMNQKATQISHLEGMVSEKDGEIGNLQETINQKATQISHLEGMVSEKDGEIGNLQEAINQKATQISQLESVGWEREATLNHIYNSHGWKALLAYYRARNRLLPVGTRRRKFAVSIFKLLLIAPQITNKANVIKSIYYLKKYGFRAFVQKVIQKAKKDNQTIEDVAIIKTDILLYQSNEPYRLDKILRGSFKFPIGKLNKIEILTANYKTKTSGIKLSLKDKQTDDLIREITLNGDQIRDDDYSVFIFDPILDSANKTYEFTVQGLSEPYSAVWYNPHVSFPEINLEPQGSINCRIYSAEEIKDIYQLWIEKNEPKEKDLEEQRSKKFVYEPKISIIVPLFNTPKLFLIDMIESVLNQTYSNWELCMADGASKGPHVKEVIEYYAKGDSRIRVKFLDENEGIAGNSNEALSLATGDFIALLDHDDTLAPFALFEVVKALNENPEADFIYSDEDKISEKGDKRFYPHFKPDWSPDTLRSYNYIAHLAVIRKKIVDEVGGFREGYEGSQDYDLILRVIERTQRIEHIPKVLYHWRSHLSSAAHGEKTKIYAYDSAKKALNEHINRMGLHGEVYDGLFFGPYQIKYHIDRSPTVSIIIPTKDKVDVLKRCITSILQKSFYKNHKIFVVDNQSIEPETFKYYKELENEPKVKILYYNKPFNFSAINNYAISQIDSEYIIFLNNDTEIISCDWIEAMLEFAQRKDVGAVGALLYYPNNTIQHAGVILGLGGVVGHSHKYLPRNTAGYMGRAKIIQNLSAVTAACLMTKKEVFYKVNGFNENYSHAFNDVDFCLNIRRSGYLIVYTPYVELYHHESLSRGYEDTKEKKIRFKNEIDNFQRKWKDFLTKGDPYYNPNLTLDREDFSIRI